MKRTTSSHSFNVMHCLLLQLQPARENSHIRHRIRLPRTRCPGRKERLSSFVRAAQDANADFIIELGDFCRLDSANQVFHDIWNSFPRDKYHTIGNHDMDAYTPDEYVAGMKMPGRYYSFDKGDFHFIVLDGNNLYDGKNTLTIPKPTIM